MALTAAAGRACQGPVGRSEDSLSTWGRASRPPSPPCVLASPEARAGLPAQALRPQRCPQVYLQTVSAERSLTRVKLSQSFSVAHNLSQSKGSRMVPSHQDHRKCLWDLQNAILPQKGIISLAVKTYTLLQCNTLPYLD